jgi:DNA-binding PadR family transcriptional regulator
MFRFLILGLLRGGANRHGYALVKAYRERSGADVSTGNFYRELQRLVVDGLIRGADNPPGADARRTPYEITALGITVFDEWLSAPQVGAGSAPEDEISARALFAEDADPQLILRVFEHLQENLWFAGKALERARQQGLTRAAAPDHADRFSGLPLLLSRRLKHIATDLEFLDEFRIAYEQWLGARARPPQAAAPAAAPAVTRRPRRREARGGARRARSA